MNKIHIYQIKSEESSNFNGNISYMAVNQELKSLIELIKYSKGLKQSEVANQIGVKPTYLSDMINGRVPFSSSIKEQIYEVYSDCLKSEPRAQSANEQQHSQQASGNGITQTMSSAVEFNKVLEEISEMRKLIQEQVRNNQEQFDRFMSVIERLTGK